MVATETPKRDSEESVILCPISGMVDPNVAAIASKDTVRLITKSTKPGVIMIEKSSDNKLRSGKWTVEEETYAKILIDLFEEGCIDDDRITKKGMTLRAYLSRKLHCSPMRISKKFAGRGIGKLVYMSKNPMKYQRHAQSIQDESLLYKLNLLEQAESNFLRIAFPDRDPTIRVSNLLLLQDRFVYCVTSYYLLSSFSHTVFSRIGFLYFRRQVRTFSCRAMK